MAAQRDDEAGWSAEAARRVWGGAVPLQVHLHDADVTTLPPPPPFLVKPHAFPIIVFSFSACGYALQLEVSHPNLGSLPRVVGSRALRFSGLLGCLFGLQSF
jgi:autophagy-related protein 5